MLMLEFRSLSWWYWLVTVLLLSAGVSGWPVGFQLATGLMAAQWLHFTIRDRSAVSFPAQIRLAFLLMLLVFWSEKLRPLYWMPVVGTWALVLFGYCPMARILSLMPWNRAERFSLALLRRTFLSAPVRGSILQGLPP
jgi:hypothetical protein